MKKNLFVCLIILSSDIPLNSCITASSGGCYGLFSCQAAEAASQYSSCSGSCEGWSVRDPSRCRRGCNAQYGGALNDAADSLDSCLAQR